MYFVASYKLKVLAERRGSQLSALKAFKINLAVASYRLFLRDGNMAVGLIRSFKLSLHDKKDMEASVSLAHDGWLPQLYYA
jgi:hypothetical protein